MSVKFIACDQLNNKSTCVQIKAWHRTGDKPLSGPLITFYGTYMHHFLTLNLSELTFSDEVYLQYIIHMDILDKIKISYTCIEIVFSSGIKWNNL